MASAQRIELSLVGVAVVDLMLVLTLVAGVVGMEAMREQHCDRLSRTAAQIEAAEGRQPERREDGEGEHACVHEAERAVQAGGGA